MFAALSWLLDLDQGRHAASTSSSSRTNSSTSNSRSRSGSASTSASDAHARAQAARNPRAAAARTFTGRGGQPVAELRVATALPADPAATPRRPMYGSPRLSDESFADLAARKASFFGPEPTPTPGRLDDVSAHEGSAQWSNGQGRSASAVPTSASPGALRTVPLWSLSAYATEAVSLSPIPSPAPPPEPQVCTSVFASAAPSPAAANLTTECSAETVGERVLLQREGVQLSACFGSAHRTSPPRQLADTTITAAAAHTTRSRRTTTGTALAPTPAPDGEDGAVDRLQPTPEARILAWDAEVRARRASSLPPSGQHEGEGEATATPGLVSHSGTAATAEAEALLVQRAMKAALLVATPTQATEQTAPPVDLAAAPVPAVVRLHPSNPFLASAPVGFADTDRGSSGGGGSDSARQLEGTAQARLSEEQLPAASLAPVWSESGEETRTDVHAFMADALRRRSAELMRGPGPAAVRHADADAGAGVLRLGDGLISVTPMTEPYVLQPLPAAKPAGASAKGRPLYDFAAA